MSFSVRRCFFFFFFFGCSAVAAHSRWHLCMKCTAISWPYRTQVKPFGCNVYSIFHICMHIFTLLSIILFGLCSWVGAFVLAFCLSYISILSLENEVREKKNQPKPNQKNTIDKFHSQTKPNQTK